MTRRSSGSKGKETDSSSGGKGEDMQQEKATAVYAIRDPDNAHGGTRIGTWNDLCGRIASTPTRFTRQFDFSKEDRELMQQIPDNVSGTQAYSQAATWAHGGDLSVNNSPVKGVGGGKDASKSTKEPSAMAAQKPEGNRQGARSYADGWSMQPGEKKKKGKAKAGTRWVIWDFGQNSFPPKQHIFESWHDTRDERGAKFFIDNVSNVMHRKCAGSKTMSAEHEASKFLKEKGITEQHFGHSYIADFPNWRIEGVTNEKEEAADPKDRGGDEESEEGKEEIGRAGGIGRIEGRQDEEYKAGGDMSEAEEPSEETMLADADKLQEQIEVARETWLEIQERAQSMIKSEVPRSPKLGGGNVRERAGDEKGKAKLERQATEKEEGEIGKQDVQEQETSQTKDRKDQESKIKRVCWGDNEIIVCKTDDMRVDAPDHQQAPVHQQIEEPATKARESIDLRRLMGECEMTCSLATCAKDIDDMDRDSMIQCSEDQCTYHLACAGSLFKMRGENDRRIPGESDQIKCECKAKDDGQAFISKTDVAQAKAEAILAKQAKMCEELSARMTCIEKAAKEPENKKEEAFIVAVGGLHVLEGMEAAVAASMAARITAGIGGEPAKAILPQKTIAKVEHAWFGPKGQSVKDQDDMYCRTLHLAFKEATPALAVLAALAPGNLRGSQDREIRSQRTRRGQNNTCPHAAQRMDRDRCGAP